MNKTCTMTTPLLSAFSLTMILFYCSSVAYSQVTSWEITEDYTIEFSGTKAEGTFRGLSGIILFDPDDLDASKFDVELEVNTISTGNKTKDKHARGESWFYAEKFPKIHFTSNKITSLQVGYEAVGDMEIRGVKKEVILAFSFFDEGKQGMFEGELKVNREDYGIEGNLFEFVVGDEFAVTIQLTADK
ncbi:MAG: YceI family protein [Bacteroidota bacterium]